MSIASEITRITSARDDIAAAIRVKGVTVPVGAKLNTLSGYVGQITQGGGSGSAHQIGDSYGGGILAYISGYDADGTPHGIVMSSTDLSSGTAWSNVTTVSVVTNTTYGAGLANCNAIIGQAGHTASAASMCRAYTGGGYTDWVLPTKRDIEEMSKALGWMLNIRYWSSSEYGANNAWAIYPYDLYFTSVAGKINSYRVRAIRYI